VKPKNSHLEASDDALGDPEASVFKQAAGSSIDEKCNISPPNHTSIAGEFGKHPRKLGVLAALEWRSSAGQWQHHQEEI